MKRRENEYWESPDIGVLFVRLTQGKVAWFDLDRKEEVLSLGGGRVMYAGASGRTFYTFYHYYDGDVRLASTAHAKMFPAPPGRSVDHCDGDGVNNLRQNIRHLTPAEQSMNRDKFKTASGLPQSPYVGVFWGTSAGMWQASFCIPNIEGRGTPKRLGRFTCDREAKIRYDAESILYYRREIFRPGSRLDDPDLAIYDGQPRPYRGIVLMNDGARVLQRGLRTLDEVFRNPMPGASEVRAYLQDGTLVAKRSVCCDWMPPPARAT